MSWGNGHILRVLRYLKQGFINYGPWFRYDPLRVFKQTTTRTVFTFLNHWLGSIVWQRPYVVYKAYNSYYLAFTKQVYCLPIPLFLKICFCLVAQSCSTCLTPWTAACQTSLSYTISWSLRKLMLLNRWCHPTISSSVTTFPTCPQSFPASGSFPMSWLFPSGGQTIGASASASVLPVNFQGSFPLGWTGLITLQSKGLSRVFSSTAVQKHQFCDPQPSL